MVPKTCFVVFSLVSVVYVVAGASGVPIAFAVVKAVSGGDLTALLLS